MNRTLVESLSVVVCDGCGREGEAGSFPTLPDRWSRYSIDRYTEGARGRFRGVKAVLELCPPCEPRLFELLLREQQRIEDRARPMEVAGVRDGEKNPDLAADLPGFP